MQTDKKLEIDQQIQVNLRGCEVAEIEIQTSDIVESSESVSEMSEEMRKMKAKGLSISIGDEGGSGMVQISHAQTAKAGSKRPSLSFMQVDDDGSDDGSQAESSEKRPSRSDMKKDLTKSMARL